MEDEKKHELIDLKFRQWWEEYHGSKIEFYYDEITDEKDAFRAGWNKALEIGKINHPEEEKIEFLQSMQKLELENGDIVVFRTDMKLSLKQIDTLRKMMMDAIKFMGIEIKVVVLEEGMNIGKLIKTKET